jgi:hypothetical protein
MAKENKPAEAYEKNGTGVAAMKAAISRKPDPNTMSSKEVTPSTIAKRVSLGDPDRDDVKTDGIETRGNGAATRGRVARGPMA